MADRTLQIEIDVDSAGAVTALRRVETTLDGVGKRAKETGGDLSGAVASAMGFVAANVVMAAFSATAATAKDAIFGMNATLETAELKFETLMGSAKLAKEHVAFLFDFAKRTPFETGPILAASLKLQVFGGAALNTEKNLTLLGDASAASGAPIEELGFWVGRLYSNLQGGKPFGEAAMRLEELSVMTPQARQQMEEMQRAGKSANEIFATFMGTLGAFSGAMEKQAGSWAGVTSTFRDTIRILLAESFQPLFAGLRDALGSFNAWLESAEGKVFFEWMGGWVKAAAEAVGGVKAAFLGMRVLVQDFASKLAADVATVMTISDKVTPFGSANARAQAADFTRLSAAFRALSNEAFTELVKVQSALGKTGKSADAAGDSVKKLPPAFTAVSKAAEEFGKKVDAAFEKMTGADTIKEWLVQDAAYQKAVKAGAVVVGEAMEAYQKSTAKAADTLKLLGKETEAAQAKTKLLATYLDSHPLTVRYTVTPTVGNVLPPLGGSSLAGWSLPPELKRNIYEIDEVTRDWGQSLSDVGRNISQLGGTVGSFGQTLSSLGDVMSFIKKSGAEMGDKLSAGFAMAAAVVQQYAGASLAAAVATGALSGASAGAALGMMAAGAKIGLTAGLVGAAIGAAIGGAIALYGYLQAKQAAYEKEVQEANNSLAAYKQQLMNVAGSYAEVLIISKAVGVNLKDVWGETGPWALKIFTQRMNEFTEAQKTLIESVKTGVGLAYAELLNLMKTYQRVSGDAHKTSDDWYKANLQSAGEGLTVMLGGMQTASDEVARRVYIAAQIAKGSTREAAEETSKNITGTFITSQAQMTGLSAAVVGDFGEMIARGVSFKEALASIQGPLTTLQQQVWKTGYGGGAAFDILNRMSEIAGGTITGPLSESIQGAQQALTGLHNAGILNQEMFSGIALTATDAYSKIISEGGNGTAALAMMQPTLQTIWKLQKDFGYEVDSGTQSLLDQAVASGIVGEKALTDAEKQTLAMQSIAESMGVLIDYFRRLFPGAVEEGYGKVKTWTKDLGEELDRTLEKERVVKVRYDDPMLDEWTDNGRTRDGGGGGRAASGGIVMPWGIARFRGGGMVGTDTVPAMLTPGEIVINAAQQGRVASALTASSSQPVNITVITQLDGREIARNQVRHLPSALLAAGY